MTCKKCNDEQWFYDSYSDKRYPCSDCRKEKCLTCFDSGTYYTRNRTGKQICWCEAGQRYKEENSKIEVKKKDMDLLWHLIPPWAKESEPNLCPTMYGTGSHENDLKVIERIKEIFQK